VRFALACAGILAAALFVFSNDQAHAVPDFRDGWVDQGGKWHAFWPNTGNGGTAGQPPAEGGDANSGGGNTHSGDSPAGNDAVIIGDSNGEDAIGVESGNTGKPQSGDSSDADLAGLNTIFNDLPLDNGPPGGSGGSPDSGSPGNTGGTQSGDAGGRNVTPGGSRHAVPEPSSIALLTGALIAAGTARRRKPAK
jgi:hypothetical protein